MNREQFCPPAPVLFWFVVIALVLAACSTSPGPTPATEEPPVATTALGTPIPAVATLPAISTPRPTSTLGIAPTPAPVDGVISATVRVRKDPSSKAEILDRLARDARIVMTARHFDNQWVQIVYPPGSDQHAWIPVGAVQAARDLSNLPIAERLPEVARDQALAYVPIDQNKVFIRTSPCQDCPKLGQLPETVLITVTGRTVDGGWFEVIIPPVIRAAYPPTLRPTGWLSASEITFLTSSDALHVTSNVASATISPTLQIALALTPTPSPATGSITPAPGTTAAPPSSSPSPRPTVAGASGGRVLLASNSGGSNEIYVVRESGLGLSRLASGSSSGARFSPDGGKVVFSRLISTSPSPASHIYVMRSDGTGLADLSKGSSDSDTDPDWSPDGGRIVYVHSPRVGGPELWVMNADGSGMRQLIGLTSDTVVPMGDTADFAPRPRWSPDGRRIAFAAVFRPKSSRVAFFPSIYTISADGAGLIQLTDNDLLNTGPVWSPDGRRIAWSAKDFFDRSSRQNWRVWVMNADGSGQRVFIGSPDGDPFHAAQAVDWLGSRLLIAGWHDAWDAYIYSDTGVQLQMVTSGPGDNRPTGWAP